MEKVFTWSINYCQYDSVKSLYTPISKIEVFNLKFKIKYINFINNNFVINYL